MSATLGSGTPNEGGLMALMTRERWIEVARIVVTGLIALDLIAYRSLRYQVLALPGAVAAPRPAPRAPAITSATTATTGANTGGPVSLATLLQLAQQRRG